RSPVALRSTLRLPAGTQCSRDLWLSGALSAPPGAEPALPEPAPSGPAGAGPSPGTPDRRDGSQPPTCQQMSTVFPSALPRRPAALTGLFQLRLLFSRGVDGDRMGRRPPKPCNGYS